MDRRGFLCIMGVLATGAWLGIKGLLKRTGSVSLKEAMHYRRPGE